jgi:ribosomal protein S18 acetylase RimI-like enzyme
MTEDWLAYAKTVSMDGKASIVDEQAFVVEWKKTDILSPHLAAFKKDISDLATEKLSKSELLFLKAYPEAASSELFLSGCKPLLDNGVENADWSAIKDTIKATVKQFYLADLSKFGTDMIKPLLNDVYFCATVRKSDETEPLGFLLFSITPALPFGDVKVINFFIREDSASEDSQNILMGMIFKIFPQTKRIFLFVRPTDSAALEMYTAMGFERDANPFEDPSHKINHQYLASLEYRTESSEILQRTVKEMVDAIK